MVFFRVRLSLLLLLVLFCPPAAAQTGKADECLVYVRGIAGHGRNERSHSERSHNDRGHHDFDGEPGWFNACGSTESSRAAAVYVPGAVQRAIARSLGFFPPGFHPPGSVTPSPAGSGEEEDAALAIAGSAVIAPAGGVADALPTPWNTWTDGRLLHNDWSAASGDLDGPAWNGIAGLDYKFTSRATAGILVSVEGSHSESPLADTDSSGIGVGPYVGLTLTDHLVFSANLLRSWIGSEQNSGIFAFDTDRLQASAALNGYWYTDTLRFNPALTLSLSRDWEEEEHGFFVDRTISVGVLTSSVQIGNSISVAHLGTVEPWVGAALDWTFLSRVESQGLGAENDPETDLRLQAGINVGLGERVQLAITGEALGLLLEDLDSYAVEASLAVQF